MIDIKKAVKENDIEPFLTDPKNMGQIVETTHELLNSFEYDRVAKVMKFLNWTWATCENKEGVYTSSVPDKDRLKAEVQRLLNCLLESRCHQISTGGITIGYKIYEPLEGEPINFRNCVDLYAYFALTEFSSIL